MGFSFISYDILLPKPIDDLLDIWAHIKHMMIRPALLYHLVLFDSTDDRGHRPLSDSSSPTASESFKKSLPIVRFEDFIKRSGVSKAEYDQSGCTVCMSHIEGGHEIRELWNCSHVFHAVCLDRWVDQGHMTCPLCRSTLMPQGGYEKKVGEESWMVDRIAYLFGED